MGAHAVCDMQHKALKKLLARNDADRLKLLDERDAALARAEKAEAELTEVLDYAGHARNCARVYFDSSCTCDCGWDAMRKRHHEARALLAKGQGGEEGK